MQNFTPKRTETIKPNNNISIINSVKNTHRKEIQESFQIMIEMLKEFLRTKASSKLLSAYSVISDFS